MNLILRVSATVFFVWTLLFAFTATAQIPQPRTPIFAGISDGDSVTQVKTFSILEETGATVYYTVNGGIPTAASTRYTRPISVHTLDDGEVTVRAIAIRDGLQSSVATLSFFLDLRPEPPIFVGFPQKEVVYAFGAIENLEITSNTPGCDFYYVLKPGIKEDPQTEPTLASTQYKDSFTVPDTALNQKLTAIAVKNGFSSTTTLANITLAETFITLATPVCNISTNEVISQTKSMTISLPESVKTFIGGKIYYTLNNTLPTNASTLYTDPVDLSTLPDGNYTLRARTHARAEVYSAELIVPFTLSLRAGTPVIAGVAEGATVINSQDKITVTVAQSDAIVYTLDGSSPSLSSLVYSAPLPMSVFGGDGPKVLKVAGCRNNAIGPVATRNFTLQLTTGQVAQPVIANLYDNENVTTLREVSISCATEGATIRYTTNGADPTEASPIYSAPLSVATLWSSDGNGKQLKVKAFKAGVVNASAITARTFNLSLRPATPVISGIANGAVITTIPQSISIKESTGATIYYTHDTTPPTSASVRYTASFGPRTHWTTNGIKTIKAIAYRNGFASSVSGITFTLNIFPDAPAIAFNNISNYTISNNIYNRGNIVVTGNGTLHYKVDNGSWTAYSAPLNIKKMGSGTHTFVARLTNPTTGLTSTTTQVFSYNGSDPSNTNRWLDHISDHVRITQLSIPGTHESGADNDGTGGFGFVQCQSTGIRRQLDIGVRYLDIRIYQDMSIYHGKYYLGKSFSDVCNIIKSFLDANPSEFVIMSIKDENGGGDQGVWTNNVATTMRNTGKWAENLSPHDFTVGELRGKFIILRRFGHFGTGGIMPGSWPNDWYSSSASGTPPLWIQDAYNYGTFASSKIGNKMNYITMCLNNARNNSIDNGVLYLNYTNATGFSTPGTWAGLVNGKVSEWITNNPKGRMGVVIMDFVGKTEDVPGKIFKSNKFPEL